MRLVDHMEGVCCIVMMVVVVTDHYGIVYITMLPSTSTHTGVVLQGVVHRFSCSNQWTHNPAATPKYVVPHNHHLLDHHSTITISPHRCNYPRVTIRWQHRAHTGRSSNAIAKNHYASSSTVNALLLVDFAGHTVPVSTATMHLGMSVRSNRPRFKSWLAVPLHLTPRCKASAKPKRDAAAARRVA